MYLDTLMFSNSIFFHLMHLTLELKETVLKMSSVKQVIILCGDSSLHKGLPYEIGDGIIATTTALEKLCNKP